MLQAIKSEGSRAESPEGYSKLVNDFIDSIHRLSVGNPQATTAELINMYLRVLRQLRMPEASSPATLR